jgi:hypothetical protein
VATNAMWAVISWAIVGVVAFVLVAVRALIYAGQARFPRRHDRRAVPGDAMSNIEIIRADKMVIERAAADLRHRAILAAYSGLDSKHYAFALALVLDELARHARDVDDGVRSRIVQACRAMLGEG